MSSRSRWRVGVIEEVSLGTAEFVPDPGRPGGWTLLVDGVAQSYVDLEDPTHLEFEYARRMASLINSGWPAGEPIRVLHLGGGGMTLPRYVAAVRPGSSQLVVERDDRLVAAVERVLPLPPEADVDVVLGDAVEIVETKLKGSRDRFDLVIADAYEGARLVPGVAHITFANGVTLLLNPNGIYVVNVADMPPLMYSRQQAAALRHVFPDVCVVGEPRLLRGRRFGNVVLAAAMTPGGLPIERLALAASRDPAKGRILHGADLDAFVAGAIGAIWP